MQVDNSKTIIIDSEHSIEFGQASWDPSEMSIRRRKNNKNGGFDPHSSSEISINGHVSISRLFLECLRNDLIGPNEMSGILNEIIDSSKRKNHSLVIL